MFEIQTLEIRFFRIKITVLKFHRKSDQLLHKKKSFVNVTGFMLISISGRVLMILFRDKFDATLTIEVHDVEAAKRLKVRSQPCTPQSRSVWLNSRLV